MNMNYDQFKDTVAEGIRIFLGEEFKDATVEVRKVNKANVGELDSLIIRKPGENVTPNIYLRQFFEMYEETGDFEATMNKIADLRKEVDSPSLPFNIDDVKDFSKIRSKIGCRLINTENNSEYLKNKPSTQVADLSVIYTIEFGTINGEDRASSVITDVLMDDWGITLEELNEAAMENLKNSDITFKSIREQMIELMFPDGVIDEGLANLMLPPEDASPMMYVLTNRDKHYGAAQVLNLEKMDEIAEKLDGDFIILPSSVHEVLILPNASGMDRETLEDMVRNVNATEVAPGEVLSGNVYCYDAANREIVTAVEYEQRNAA